MTDTPHAGATWYAGSRVQRVEDPRLLDRTRHVRRRHPAARHAPRAASSAARTREPGSSTSTRPTPAHSTGCTRSSSRRTSTRVCTSSGTRCSVPSRTTRRAHRSRRARSGSWAIPSRSVLAEDRYVAEDAADMVVVDYEPLTAVVDFLAAADAPDLVHAAHGSNLIGGMAGAPATAGRGGLRRRRPRRHLDGGSAVTVRVPDGNVRASSSTTTAGTARSPSTPRRRLPTRSGPSRRGCSECRRTGSVSSCATPVAGSARRS